jgi:hypothetical protein
VLLHKKETKMKKFFGENTLAYFSGESVVQEKPNSDNRVNLTKQFWSKFTHTFCKLHRFINICSIYGSAMKRTSLQKD